MIESTNLKMLRNLEAFQVFSDILAFLQEEESVEEPLQGLCDAFAARLSDYDTALVSERRSRYTAELARLDGQRDYVFRSFTAQLKLYLSSFDSGQVKAAEALLALDAAMQAEGVRPAAYSVQMRWPSGEDGQPLRYDGRSVYELPAELLDATPAAGLPAALERWNARWEAAQEKK